MTWEDVAIGAAFVFGVIVGITAAVRVMRCVFADVRNRKE